HVQRTEARARTPSVALGRAAPVKPLGSLVVKTSARVEVAEASGDDRTETADEKAEAVEPQQGTDHGSKAHVPKAGGRAGATADENEQGGDDQGGQAEAKDDNESAGESSAKADKQPGQVDHSDQGDQNDQGDEN